MSRAETANRRTLFQDLRSAEETAHAYRKLWAEALSLAAYADRGSVLRGVAEREAARFAEIMDEMEADADTCRQAIISAGWTAEDYEAWNR